MKFPLQQKENKTGANGKKTTRLNNNHHDNRIERRNSRFFTIFYCAANCLQHVGSSGQALSCANHVQHIGRSSRATCRVPRGTKGQLSYYVWQSWNRIYLSFILLAETINWQRREGNRSIRKKTLATSFRICHKLKPENSSPKGDSNPHSGTGGRLGKQTC